MKVLILLLVTTLLSHAQTSQPAEDNALHIYLLIGQSNMSGRAAYSEEDAQVINRCFLLNKEDAWEPAQVPLNRHSSIRKQAFQGMNPGYGFAQVMLEAQPEVQLGLVVNARGGTNIASWQKGTEYFKEAVRRTKAAIEAGGTLKGILWHQGEADSRNKNYQADLTQLIADFRAAFERPELPVVVGEIRGGHVKEAIAAIPAAVPHTACASSAGFTLRDRAHYDNQSQKLLGQRFGQQMLSLIKETK